MEESIVYHGSADKIDAIEPRRNKRFRNNELIWDAVSFHATPHKWIALAYTRSKNVPETTGIDLYEHKHILDVVGPTNLEDALGSLYGEGGWLYEFLASDFKHADGLGNLEVYVDKPVSPVKTTRVEDAVTELKKAGVEFRFTKQKNPKDFVVANNL